VFSATFNNISVISWWSVLLFIVFISSCFNCIYLVLFVVLLYLSGPVCCIIVFISSCLLYYCIYLVLFVVLLYLSRLVCCIIVFISSCLLYYCIYLVYNKQDEINTIIQQTRRDKYNNTTNRTR
jgi:asparagine N-glycosylation enzyme membrane subunit Stt3